MKKNNLFKTLWKCYSMYSLYITAKAFVKARGLNKEDDRHLIGKAIDRLAGYTIDPDETIVIDDTELHISYNPYLQLFTGSLGGIAVIINDSTEVITDAQYRNMSKNTQYAILCHEMGHRKNNHTATLTYKLDRIKAILNGGVLPMELEADAYAVSIVGKKNMIMALVELAANLHGLSRKEVIYRIRAIKEGGEF